MSSGSTIEPMKSKNGMVFKIVIKGKLGKEDYEEFVPQLECQIAKDGKIDLLIELIDFHGWTIHGLWEDIKFAVKHFSHVGRIAVVGGGKPWEHGITTLAKLLTRAEVRFFREKHKAMQWVEDGESSMSPFVEKAEY